ncbi:MAG: DUF6807 family protein [bacterium]
MSDYQLIDQQPFSGQTRRLKMMRDGCYFASFIVATDYPTHFRLKPEIHPLCTPAGMPVTDSHQYCFIHHQALMLGHGKVLADGDDKPVDFYRKLPFPDAEREDRFHSDFNLFEMGPSGIQALRDVRWSLGERIVLELTLDWRTRQWGSGDGEILMTERRLYALHQTDRCTVVDVFTHLEPADRPVTLKADLHSLPGVRVHDLIDHEDGGTLRDSLGRVNQPGKYFGLGENDQPPAWVDCTGRVGGQVVGVAMIAHPDNQRNQWYYREFGLMEVSPALSEDVRVTAAEPLNFAVRYVAHDGELTDGQVAAFERELAELTPEAVAAPLGAEAR